MFSNNCDYTGGTAHWICTCCTGNGIVQVLDSLGFFMQMNDTIVFQIAKIFAVPDQSSVKIRKLSVQQQDGTLDCGAFAVAFATEFCFRSNPENVFFDQSLMRQHLYDCLDAGVMKRFPQCPKINNFLPIPKSTFFTIPLHCECRMPENFDTLMVACDVCNEWFHVACVGLNKECIPRTWLCKICAL